MPRAYPPLTLREIEAILTYWGFVAGKPKATSHRTWRKTYKGHTYLVIVDENLPLFADDILHWMVRNSGLQRAQFFGACKSAAKKAGVLLLKAAK